MSASLVQTDTWYADSLVLLGEPSPNLPLIPDGVFLALLGISLFMAHILLKKCDTEVVSALLSQGLQRFTSPSNIKTIHHILLMFDGETK